MTESEEITQDDVLRQMRTDLDMIEQVAQVVSLNREAFAMIAQRVATKENQKLDDGPAAHMARYMFNMLNEFAGDLKDAIERTESGERVVKVVRVDGDETKH